MKLKNKKAAIELSIGTIVIIVLAMSMLVLGIVLIRNILGSSIDNVKQIDRGVKNEINKLFSSDTERRVVLYPDSGIIKLKQGTSGEGFALSIRNTESTGVTKFGYEVTLVDDATELRTKCGTTTSPIEGNGWARIVAGRELRASQGISLAAGNIMEDPVHVRFAISNTAPICIFRVKVEIEKDDGSPYDTKFMDIQVTPE